MLPEKPLRYSHSYRTVVVNAGVLRHLHDTDVYGSFGINHESLDMIWTKGDCE